MEDFYIIENNNLKLRELYLKILTLKKYKIYLIDKVENKIIEIKNNLKRDIKNNIKSKILKVKEKRKLDNKKNIIKNIKINKVINEKGENKIHTIELNNEIKEIDIKKDEIDSKKDEISIIKDEIDIIKDNINSEIINIEEIENKEKYKKKLNDGLENIDVGCVICCDGICGVCEYIKYEMSKFTNYINEILNNQIKKYK